jgi:hypothetical protein
MSPSNMKNNGALLALGGAALLAGVSIASSRSGSGYRMPAGGGDFSNHPTLDEVQELISNDYSVDEITDVFPDSVSFPSGDVVGVLIHTRDRGPFLLTERGGGAVLRQVARGGSASVAVTGATALLTYLGYSFIKGLARKKSQRFLAADLDGQIEMLREEGGLNRRWFDPRAKISRTFIRMFLSDRDRAETLAETVATFLRKHGKDAEKAADLALATHMKSGAVIMAAARELEDKEQATGSRSRGLR